MLHCDKEKNRISSLLSVAMESWHQISFAKEIYKLLLLKLTDVRFSWDLLGCTFLSLLCEFDIMNFVCTCKGRTLPATKMETNIKGNYSINMYMQYYRQPNEARGYECKGNGMWDFAGLGVLGSKQYFFRLWVQGFLFFFPLIKQFVLHYSGTNGFVWMITLLHTYQECFI